VTCPLNYIVVVTRVNVARTHTNRHTGDSISGIVTPSCPICVQRNIEFRSRARIFLYWPSPVRKWRSSLFPTSNRAWLCPTERKHLA